MPKKRNGNDEDDFQYDQKLLEKEESSVAERRGKLQIEGVSYEGTQLLIQQHNERYKEQRDTSNWKFGIYVALAVAMTYIGTNLLNRFIDFQSELREVGNRLTVLESIHTEQYFRPVHIHPVELSRDPADNFEESAP